MIGVQAQKDVTSQYITNATLSSLNGWTNVNFNAPQRGNNTVGYASECYAGWGSLEKTNYSLTQDITLPAGHYTLVNYSFFRYGLNADTDASKSLAFLKAGEQQVAIKTLGSITASGYANSQAEGANCFDSKMYRNTLDFTIDADNTVINIGLVGTFDLKQSWMIAGMFELINNDIPATMDAPFDVTGYITNPGFEYRDMSGWTVEPSGYFGTQSNNQSFKVGGYYAEKWQGSGALPEGSMSQTLTNLPAGYYKLTANLGGNGTYVDLNGKRASWTADKDYVVGYVLSENEDLTITAGKTSEGTANWIHFDNFRLQFCGDVQAALTTLLNTAKDLIDNAKMNASVKANLQTAYDTYNHSYSDVDELLAAIDAMQDAVDAAQASVNIYTNINAAISTFAAKAASLDADGQAAYDASSVTTKYNNGTYVTFAEAEAELQAALTVATKAQTTAGSDWTGLIVNPSFETGDFSGWTNDGMATQNNTSFEKDGVYYAEAWQPNGTKSVKQTISAMPSGVYRLSAKSKARGVTSAKIFANGINKAITIADETATYSVEFACDANANVEFGFEGVGTGAGSSWLCVDNFTLSLVSAGLPDVTPVVGKMNAEVAAAQTTAIATYEANRTVANYNAASAAVAAAQASVGAYAAANAAIVKAEGIIAETNVFVAANKIAYQDAINTAKSAYNAGSMKDATATSLENNLNGGTVYKHEGDPMRPFYSGAWSATNEVSIYTNNWSVEGNTDGSNFTTPFIEDWVVDANSLANTTISASVTNLPSGTYNVTARVRMRLKNNGEAPVNGLSLQASSGDPVAVSGTPNYGSFYVAEVAATGYVTEEGGSLGINFIVNNTNASWLSIKAVNYERTGDLPAADAADYAALNAAISAVSGNVAGFEAGEYAPYNNKEAFAALATAEAIDPSVVNAKPTVQAATAVLTGATWTANTEEVNAIRWHKAEDYSSEGETKVPTGGFIGSDANSRISHNPTSNTGLSGLTQSMALMVIANTNATYGETEGYTLPLKASTVYEFKFKYAGWGECGTPTITLLKGNETIKSAPLSTPAKTGNNNTDAWEAASVVFTTTEAGDYKVRFSTAGGRDAFGDLELKKAPASVSVTLDATTGYATFGSQYPLNLIPENLTTGVKAYKATTVDGENITFEALEQGVPANTGILIAGEPGQEVTIPVATSTSAVEGNLLHVNASGETFDAESGYSYYGLKKGTKEFRPFAPGTVAIPANKAYLRVENINPARLIISFDDEEDPTGINVIEAAEAETGALKDGKYLIGNKVVLVKNGVKYGANGQKLN